MFRQDCTCPALLEDERSHYPYGTVTLCGSAFLTDSGCLAFATGLVRVRSPLLAESRGNPRIKAPSQLPAAYRSVARPSSPLSAKASTKRP